MTRPQRVLLVLPLVCLMAVTARATVLNFTPDKDNTLVQTNDPDNQLSDGADNLFVGRTNQDPSGPAVSSLRRGLVHFDLSTIPSGATITGVTLTMQELEGRNGSQTVSLRAALQDWGQGTSAGSGTGAPAENNDATWLYTFYNAANPASSPTWSTPGGDFSGVTSASTLVTTLNPLTFAWSSSQMIADVQGWVSNPATNFGWGIFGNEAVTKTAKEFAGSDAGSGLPTLEVTFSVPEPSTWGLFAIGASLLGIASRRRRR